MSQTIRKRADIPTEDTWNLADLYVSDEDWEKDLEILKQEGVALAAYNGKLNHAESLYNYLFAMEQADERADRLGNYCMRKADEDTRNATYQAMSGKFMSAVVELGAQLSFETPEIMAIDDATLEGSMPFVPSWSATAGI